MDDLIAFLNARLDEDEAAAKANISAGPGCSRGLGDAEGFGPSWPDYQTYDSAELDAATGYLDHFRPLRMLREVEAKRSLLRMHQPVPFWGNNPPPLKDRIPENAKAWYCECQCPDGVIQGAYPCDTARLIIAVYSDHPDYDQEGKP